VAFAGHGWQGGHLFALPWNFPDVAANILPPPEKRKRQNGGSGLRIGLHILPDGMCWRAIPFHGLCARLNRAKPLGFPVRDALASSSGIGKFKPEAGNGTKGRRQGVSP
jgi:hypothetical protein